MEQRVIISTQLESELVSALSECEHDKLFVLTDTTTCLLYTSPSPRDTERSRMPSSA